MAGRVQQDAFIDDSDESCPLCVEEFDLSDKISDPVHAAIKQKADVALQARKKAMARKKETEQKQVETTNRKNLAGLRVVQKNLVYVVGLSQKSSEEEFLRTLRGPQYFGQYGKITKIVVSKAKEGQTGNNSIGVYVTFENKDDAAKCIAAVDGSQNLDRPLRAQYGTTKYCSAFLRNETCGNRNCTFLHETGEDNDSFSRQDLSSMNALSTQRPAQQPSSSRPNQQAQPQAPPQQAPQSISAASQPVPSKGTHDEAMSRSDSGDGSALPSSASWAAKNAPTESRKSSKPASVAAPSPVVTNATVSSQASDTQQAPTEPDKPLQSSDTSSQTSSTAIRHRAPEPPCGLEAAMRIVSTSTIKFVFDRSMYTPEQLRYFESCPPPFDPNGGLVRYRIAKAQEQERQKQEEERNVLRAISAADGEDETPASGSLQLGGEPEPQDALQDNSGRMSAQQRNAIQPPFGSSSAFPFSGPSFQASGAAIPTRTLTPQQQQQLSLLRSRSSRQSPVNGNQYQQGYTGTTSLHHHQQSNPFQMQNQTPAFTTAQGHAKQASRFTFANDSASASTAVKPVANPQLMAQQSAMMPTHQNKQYQNQPAQQSNVHGNHFYSGVQGPPPGLKSSGTPPISGGGMFGQGHGFANAMGGSAGFGNNVSSKNSNDELMRELLRTRAGSTNGMGPDVGKREFKFPFAPQPMTSDAPASSLLSPLYGSQLGTHNGYQDHNLQKQKKKGKKHRHANTSSSGGGGIVDLADPSILQARMHHGAAGQGQYGAQGQEPSNVSRQQTVTPLQPPPDQPAAPSASKPTTRTTPAQTPLPPSLSLPQDFPPLVAPAAPPPAPPRLQRKVTSGAPIKPVVPVLPTPSARPTVVPKETQTDGHAKDKEQHSTAPESPAVGGSTITDQPRYKNTENNNSVALSREVDEKVVPTPSKNLGKKQRPGKLDIAAAKETSKQTLEIEGISAEGTNAASTGKREGSNGFEPSQPPTPKTAASQTSIPSVIRQAQPRATRIPPGPKAEASSPGLAGPSSKQASRRPSLTSNHRPDTPASERVSDTVSFTSNTISRANSPPPSRVGSAPVRQFTKNQQKKERQARAKQADQAEASTKTEEPEAKVEEVQAPIVGRKKKTKKERAQGTADSTPTATRPTSPVQKEDMVEDKAPTAPVTPVKPSKKGVPKLASETKDTETPPSPATPATGEQQKASLTAAAIFQGLLDAGEVNATAKEIFSPVPGLNHRFEILEPAFAEDIVTRISHDDHVLLDQGEAIPIGKDSNNHMVMFPDRRILQGFSAAQASRYLELRKQALLYGDDPSHQALESMIPGPPPLNVLAANANSNQKILSNKFYTPTAQPETAGRAAMGYGEEGRKGAVSVVDAEREAAVRRKETEGLEKKLNALLKRNRRLVFGNAH